MLRIAAVIFVVTLLLWTTSFATPDPISAWDSVATQYNFLPYAAASDCTFVEAYYGPNYPADIAGITSAMNSIMAVELPRPTIDDILGKTIPAWGLK
jgi:hypothetical protein